jgi:hypothetical protein
MEVLRARRTPRARAHTLVSRTKALLPGAAILRKLIAVWRRAGNALRSLVRRRGAGNMAGRRGADALLELVGSVPA